MKSKQIGPLIALISVCIPILVAILLYIPRDETGGLADQLSFIPALNAGINSTVAILLLLALFFIRKGNIHSHKLAMLSAVGLSVLFLAGYLFYHYVAGDVKYNGVGTVRNFYFVILISHILLSIAVVPLVLFAVVRGLNNQVQSHKKIVKFAWPIWFYVAVTGVIVYLMAHPFNPVVT